jgi:D-tyrosyl-tRNA(Tyr) deacylase
VKALLQRVERAVLYLGEADGGRREHARIGAGLVVLLGVAGTDDEAGAVRLAEKTAGLRIFADEDGKLNRDARDAGAALLVVSQFTLLADARKGRRPSFVRAARPDVGERLYQRYVAALRDQGFAVETGVFGAHMLVEIHNDGPVTIMLDTDEL